MLDAQGQFVTKSRINIYEALALFSFDLKQSNVVKRRYGVGGEVAEGVITELLAEGVWYGRDFTGDYQERSRLMNKCYSTPESALGAKS